MQLHPDRLFSSDPTRRQLARELYQEVAGPPIVSPHGHTDPAWFAEDRAFSNPLELLILPDHYLLRMLHSQGLRLEPDPRQGWSQFVDAYRLFRGTPSKMWLDHVFYEVFGLREPLSADHYEILQEALQSPEFRPRALFDRFRIEVLATTDAACDDLRHHRHIAGHWPNRRILPTYRPDSCLDPDHPLFQQERRRLGELTGQDTDILDGYLEAHRLRRHFFKECGATATDHGPPTPLTLDLSRSEAEALFAEVVAGERTRSEAFRAYMLIEMARMSVEDGLVMQLHAGSHRNHNRRLFESEGPDRGADIPRGVSYTDSLKPLLNRFGEEPNFRLIVFTLDESTYSRELAPLAGHYPALVLGPPWWFHDSPEGMLRYRRQVTETAGFYNTAGFNDDTRALLSIPARHDMARRMDCRFLAELVAEHRLTLEEGHELAVDLAGGLARRAYRL